MMSEDYVKIVYRSEPIGKEQIILELTTFDIDAFEKDKELEKIPTKKKIIEYSCDRLKEYRYDQLELINNYNKQFEEFIEKTYAKQIEEMKAYIEFLRNQENLEIKQYKGD